MALKQLIYAHIRISEKKLICGIKLKDFIPWYLQFNRQKAIELRLLEGVLYCIGLGLNYPIHSGWKPCHIGQSK